MVVELLSEHSLLISIGVTGIGWTLLFLRINPESKLGQVVGNIVSEWVQMAGLAFLTKQLMEVGSKGNRLKGLRPHAVLVRKLSTNGRNRRLTVECYSR